MNSLCGYFAIMDGRTSLLFDPAAAVKKNETPEGQPFFIHLAGRPR